MTLSIATHRTIGRYSWEWQRKNFPHGHQVFCYALGEDREFSLPLPKIIGVWKISWEKRTK
jgi:hypothetical protein